jgi:hypothetical protein
VELETITKMELKNHSKWKVKMGIFPKWGVGYIFPKKTICNSFSCSFFSSFLRTGRKMKTENEAKMTEKWLL